MAKAKVTNKKLATAAQELNETIGPEPEINPDELSKDELKEKVFACAGLIDPEQDEFSKETLSLLQSIDAVDDEGNPTDEAVQAAGGDDEEEDEEDDEEEVEETDEEETEDTEDDETDRPPEDLKALMDDCKKLADLKEIAEQYETFSEIDSSEYKGLNGLKQLRADMEAALGLDEEEEEQENEEQEEDEDEEKPVKSDKKDKGKKKENEEQEEDEDEAEEPDETDDIPEGRDETYEIPKNPDGSKKKRPDFFVDVLEETRDTPKTKDEFAKVLVSKCGDMGEDMEVSAAKSHITAYFPILKALGLLEKTKDGYIYKG